jgi:hypothetical protein
MKWIKTYEIFEASQNLTKEQKEWLNKCCLYDSFRNVKSKWTINPSTGLIDVDGHFSCESQELKNFKGVKFGVVEGIFDCSNNQIKTLKGAPVKVKGSFYCNNNQLKSLVGAPQEVGGDLNCEDNYIKSLVGVPKRIYGNLECGDNEITSLEGTPQITITGSFNFPYNPVSEDTLRLILNKMNGGVSYKIALAVCKKDIDPLDWDMLDKNGEISQDLEKGGSALDRFGVFDS